MIYCLHCAALIRTVRQRTVLEQTVYGAKKPVAETWRSHYLVEHIWHRLQFHSNTNFSRSTKHGHPSPIMTSGSQFGIESRRLEIEHVKHKYISAAVALEIEHRTSRLPDTII